MAGPRPEQGRKRAGRRRSRRRISTREMKDKDADGRRARESGLVPIGRARRDTLPDSSALSSSCPLLFYIPPFHA